MRSHLQNFVGCSRAACHNQTMPDLHTPSGALYVTQALAAAFLSVLFLQSGIDKVVDRRGNLEWLTGHFSKSPLRGMVPVLLLTITILELLAGVLTGIGAALVVMTRDSTIAFYGAVLAGTAILALFFGQRMAKDYAGAASLVPYFLLTLAAIYLLRQS